MSTREELKTCGPYRLLRELGHGGMGTVYEARREAGGEAVALKVFTLDHGNRDFLRKRFAAEAKILGRRGDARGRLVCAGRFDVSAFDGSVV